MTMFPLVRDHMDTEVHTLSPDAEILEAVRFLLGNRVTGAPVIDGTDRLLGMLTEKDIMKLVATGLDGEEPQGQVADFMTTDIKTVRPDMDIYYVAGLFLKEEFRRFPVIEDDRMIGAITRFDIMRALEANLSG